MERHLEDWVRAIHAGEVQTSNGTEMYWIDRFEAGWHHVKEIVGKVWPYVMAGIALGAAIHGYVPEDFMASIMGKDAPWWSVPAAVALGVPMYTNAAGIIPIVEALIGKGAALGTVLAFMMAVVATPTSDPALASALARCPGGRARHRSGLGLCSVCPTAAGTRRALAGRSGSRTGDSPNGSAPVTRQPSVRKGTALFSGEYS